MFHSKRVRERKKRVDSDKTIKREDIIGNDDEDFVLIGWQTLINAFTKLFLPPTKWNISTDTTLVLLYYWHKILRSSHVK